MPIVPVRRAWDRQPTQATDLSPYAQSLGIRLAYTPSASKRVLSGPSLSTSAYGRTISNSSTSSYGEIVSNPLMSGTDLTVMVLANVTGISSPANGFFFSIPHHGSWTAPYGVVIVGINNIYGSYRPILHLGDSGGGFDQVFGTTGAWTADSTWHWFEVVRSGTQINFYIDGADAGSTTSSRVQDYSNYQPVNIFGTPGPSSGEAPTGDCAIVFAGNNPILASERSRIRKNPWQIFA